MNEVFCNNMIQGTRYYIELRTETNIYRRKFHGIFDHCTDDCAFFVYKVTEIIHGDPRRKRPYRHMFNNSFERFAASEYRFFLPQKEKMLKNLESKIFAEIIDDETGSDIGTQVIEKHNYFGGKKVTKNNRKKTKNKKYSKRNTHKKKKSNGR